jgi:MFS superfamily sulfate permease-like transporter
LSAASSHFGFSSMVIVVLVMPIVIAMFIPMFVAMIPAMLLAVARCVYVVVPLVFHEEDRAAAGAILSAIPTPVLRVLGRHVQIQRLNDYARGTLIGDHGPRTDDGGPVVPKSI